MPLIPTFRRQRFEFEASLASQDGQGYTEKSCSQNKTKKQRKTHQAETDLLPTFHGASLWRRKDINSIPEACFSTDLPGKPCSLVQ